MSERVLPMSVEAERGALGAMLLEPLRVLPIARRMGIGPETFFVPAHGRVCGTIYEMTRPVDILTLCEELKRLGLLDQVGGQSALEKLVDGCVAVAHAEHYLDIVRQKWILRQEIAIAREIEAEAYVYERGDQHVKNVPERFMKLLHQVAPERSLGEVARETIEDWCAAARGERKAIGLDLPWQKLTMMLSGLEPGLTVIAGRPSEGKTTLEGEIALHLAGQGVPVGRVTLDMTKRDLVQRAICRLARVSLPKLKWGFVKENSHQMAQVREVAALIEKMPMWVNDQDRDIDAICGWARSMAAQKGIKLLTVDFVQLINAAVMGREQWQTTAKVTYISGALKKLSLELGIPVVLLSQLSRAVEKEDREPMLSDLRDSGALEQDAAKVLFCYRDQKTYKAMEVSEPGSTKKKRGTVFDLLKQQNGEIGKLLFWMRPHYFMFEPTESFAIEKPSAKDRVFEVPDEGDVTPMDEGLF